MLSEISVMLEKCIEAIYDAKSSYNSYIPSLEGEFATLRDGIHCLTDQLVSANEDFRSIKLRMDSIFSAAEYNIHTTQEEVDKLSTAWR